MLKLFLLTCCTVATARQTVSLSDFCAHVQHFSVTGWWYGVRLCPNHGHQNQNQNQSHAFCSLWTTLLSVCCIYTLQMLCLLPNMTWWII